MSAEPAAPQMAPAMLPAPMIQSAGQDKPVAVAASAPFPARDHASYYLQVMILELCACCLVLFLPRLLAPQCASKFPAAPSPCRLRCTVLYLVVTSARVVAGTAAEYDQS